MKIFISRKKKAGRLTICLALLFICAAAIVSSLVSAKLREASAPADCEEMQLQLDLLLKALDNVGVSTPREAAEVFAEGVKNRSAAQQMSVMTGNLREKYVSALSKSFKNWVTGVSSPWVSDFRIEKEQKRTDNQINMKLVFMTETSSGPAGDFDAELNLVNENGFWRISSIKGSKLLDVYVGI